MKTGIKRPLGEKIFEVANIIFMALLCVVMLYPMIYVLFASISDPSQLMAHKGLLLHPLGLSSASYSMMLENPTLIRSFLNTVIILVAGVSVNILITSFGAYFLTRKEVVGRNFIMFMIVFTMYFSGGTIPFYFVVSNLGLTDSYLSLILPVAISTFNLIVMRTSFSGIPESLVESAKLDGAGHFRILFTIIMPLSKAIISVMVLYYAVSHWNSWFNAMLFISDRDLYPLQLVLREILITGNTEQMTGMVDAGAKSMAAHTVQYAVIISSTLPILCIYPFIQKYFTQGVMIGAVKG